MDTNLECLGHSTIKLENGNQIIYIDPYEINDDSSQADIVFITHSHYDHFSPNDILKIKKEETLIFITYDIYDAVLHLGFSEERIICVKPNEEYKIKDIDIKTVPAYNQNTNFHPKEKNWVGYIITVNGVRYYIAGDTDITEENKEVKCDIALIPVGGTYTTNYKEAATLTNIIKPKLAIPTHYGKIVGTSQDALNYKKLLEKGIECEIFF